MSWVLVFWVLLIFLSLFVINIWWWASSDYKITCNYGASVVAGKVSSMKWGFSGSLLGKGKK